MEILIRYEPMNDINMLYQHAVVNNRRANVIDFANLSRNLVIHAMMTVSMPPPLQHFFNYFAIGRCYDWMNYILPMLNMARTFIMCGESHVIDVKHILQQSGYSLIPMTLD